MLWFVHSEHARSHRWKLTITPTVYRVQGGPRSRFVAYAIHCLAHPLSVLLGLRLAEKRSLPCPHRNEWITARDELYEQVMHKAWNPDLKIFGQSYEETHVLDSSVMIMPLVFFMNPSDPRFLSTLKAVLKSPERGGLTSNVSPPSTTQIGFCGLQRTRTSYIDTTSTRLTTALGVRRARSACVPCGACCACSPRS